MTREEILSVLEKYERYFSELGVGMVKHPHSESLIDKSLSLEHCHGMIEEMRGFIREGRIEKTFRWLGFIQGVLWMNGIFMLEQLKDDNWSEPEQI